MLLVRILVYAVIFLLTTPASSQKFTVASGVISFFSQAPLEDIKAENLSVSSILNPATGEIAFAIPINKFQFEKKLMQEHFNEKYMESDTYPKSTFAGKIGGFTMQASGVQPATAKGKLTIHGVTRDVEIPGTLEVRGDELKMNAKFIIKLEDYKIKIPKIMWQNIAEQIEVTVDLMYKPQ